LSWAGSSGGVGVGCVGVCRQPVKASAATMSIQDEITSWFDLKKRRRNAAC
jgi:hypothetical protein